MKKFLLIAATACLGLSTQGSAQVVLSQDFESTSIGSVPTNWSTTGTSWKTSNGSPTFASWTLPAHTKYALVNDYTTGAINGTAVLTTPAFSLVGNTNAMFVYDYWFVGAHRTSGTTTPETGYIKISDDSGATWTTIDTIPGATTATVDWLTRTVSLAGHTSANTMAQIVYVDNGVSLIGLAVDNILVGTVPNADLALLNTSLSFPFYPQNYGPKGSALSYTGTVQNKGAKQVTSFKLFTQVGSNPVDSTVISATINSFGNYTYTSAINLPATQGSWNTKIWVAVDSDFNHGNDSTAVSIGAYNSNPTKRLSFEEGTGTWCGWCVRGIVFMDSLRTLYGENGPSLIAVHNSSTDPMTVSAYDNYMTSNYYSSFPNVSVDRREIADPSDLLDIAVNEKDLFAFADVKIATPVVTGNSLSSTVTINPAVDLDGDYRLVLVVTEDQVHGTASGYDQHNYYAGGGYGPMRGFESLTNPVPAADMYYDHVARVISPSTTGNAGVLPTVMSAGTNYTATLTANLPSTINKSMLRTVVLLIRNSDGIVLNSASTTYWPVNVKTVSAGIDNINIFPNPAQDFTTIKMTLNQSTNVKISIVDELGRTVSTIANQAMAAGTQSINVNTASLASGLYNVKIETAKGITTERLSVVK